MSESNTIRSFGRYEVISEIGRGAMGVVYKASDPVLNRIVAIKTINLSLAQDERLEYEARFYQEAKAAGGLSHPNIVTIYDLGTTDEVVFMAMEFLEGRELRELIESGKAGAVRFCTSIAAQVAEGLAYAHERGIVHRDIKPANIMIVGERLAKLTDFGIARMRTSDVKTQTGLRLGSPKYMSPEQVLGQRTDHRSDIFSLGIVLYEMLTGKAPFYGNSLESLMYQTLHFLPPPPSRTNSAIPEILDLILAKALEKSQDDRYQSARELASDLRECEIELASSTSTVSFGTSVASSMRRFGSPQIDPEPALTMDTDDIHGSREKDESIGQGSHSGAVGISKNFDSMAATQKLAHRVGMSADFDDYAATAHLSNTHYSNASSQDESKTGFSVATFSDRNVQVASSSIWINDREKLYVGSVLLSAILISVLILMV